MRVAATAALVLALLTSPSGAQPAQPAQRAQLTAKFRDRLTEIAKSTDGVVGIGVIDLKSGERFGVNGTSLFPQGSAIKIPILIELFRQADAGTLSLEEKLPVRAADQVGGTGVSQYFGDGQS
jgi:beta-lactamase class A